MKDIKKYFRFSLISARSQLKAEIADSYLSWIWWIVEPFCFMLIYALIFGVVFQARELYFSVFIFLGLTIWNFFNRTALVSVKLIRNNKGIVSKVYIPKYVILMTKIWVNGFKMLISMGIVVVMMCFYRVEISWYVLYIFPILITLMIITFGITTILMHFGVYFDDLANVVNIALKVIFYLTGVFYNVSARVPAPFGEILEKVNPIAFLMENARNVLLYNQPPQIWWLLFWLAVGCLITALGIHLIYKNENHYVKAM